MVSAFLPKRLEENKKLTMTLNLSLNFLYNKLYLKNPIITKYVENFLIILELLQGSYKWILYTLFLGYIFFIWIFNPIYGIHIPSDI